MQSTHSLKGNIPTGKITLLQNGKQMKYTCRNGKTRITLPKGIKEESLVFRFNKAQ